MVGSSAMSSARSPPRASACDPPSRKRCRRRPAWAAITALIATGGVLRPEGCTAARAVGLDPALQQESLASAAGVRITASSYCGATGAVSAGAHGGVLRTVVPACVFMMRVQA